MTAPLNTWAQGTAPLVKPATKEDTELILVVSDIHVPFHNPQLVESAARLIKAVKPHRLVINGDLCDMNEISRFATPSEITLGGLQEQLDIAKAIITSFRKAGPNTQIDFNVGNHDFRLERFLSSFPPLAGLRSLTLGKQLGFDDLGVTSYDGPGFRLRKNLLIRHGTLVRKFAGYSAKAEMESAGVSGVSGHTHRLAIFRHNNYESRQWAEGGCLCHLNPTYVQGKPDWTNGAILIEASTKTEHFLMNEVQARDGKLTFGGRDY